MPSFLAFLALSAFTFYALQLGYDRYQDHQPNDCISKYKFNDNVSLSIVCEPDGRFKEYYCKGGNCSCVDTTTGKILLQSTLMPPFEKEVCHHVEQAKKWEIKGCPLYKQRKFIRQKLQYHKEEYRMHQDLFDEDFLIYHSITIFKVLAKNWNHKLSRKQFDTYMQWMKPNMIYDNCWNSFFDFCDKDGNNLVSFMEFMMCHDLDWKPLPVKKPKVYNRSIKKRSIDRYFKPKKYIEEGFWSAKDKAIRVFINPQVVCFLKPTVNNMTCSTVKALYKLKYRSSNPIKWHSDKHSHHNSNFGLSDFSCTNLYKTSLYLPKRLWSRYHRYYRLPHINCTSADQTITNSHYTTKKVVFKRSANDSFEPLCINLNFEYIRRWPIRPERLFAPTCDRDGYFVELHCRGKHCFCIDRETGNVTKTIPDYLAVLHKNESICKPYPNTPMLCPQEMRFRFQLNFTKRLTTYGPKPDEFFTQLDLDNDQHVSPNEWNKVDASWFFPPYSLPIRVMDCFKHHIWHCDTDNDHLMSRDEWEACYNNRNDIRFMYDIETLMIPHIEVNGNRLSLSYPRLPKPKMPDFGEKKGFWERFLSIFRKK